DPCDFLPPCEAAAGLDGPQDIVRLQDQQECEPIEKTERDLPRESRQPRDAAVFGTPLKFGHAPQCGNRPLRSSSSRFVPSRTGRGAERTRAPYRRSTGNSTLTAAQPVSAADFSRGDA